VHEVKMTLEFLYKEKLVLEEKLRNNEKQIVKEKVKNRRLGAWQKFGDSGVQRIEKRKVLPEVYESDLIIIINHPYNYHHGHDEDYYSWSFLGEHGTSYDIEKAKEAADKCALSYGVILE
jgi:hypothetical protein